MALALGVPSRGYKDTCCPIQASSLGSSVTAFSSPQSTCRPILPETPSPRELGDGLLLLFTELPRGVLLGNPYKIAVPSFYFTAVTVSRGTISVDGVQNSSLPTQASKASRSRQRVMIRTSSSPSGASSERSTSIETKPGNPCTFPRLFANRSTICPAAPFFTGRRLKMAIIGNLPSALEIGRAHA